MSARFRRMSLTAAALSVALAVALPADLAAQRRPGLGTGFYTTTGLVTLDLEGGTVNSSSEQAEAPSFAVSLVLTAPLQRRPKRAWNVGLRANPLAFGNNRECLVTPGTTGCQNVRFEERAALLTGGAWDIRSTILRAMVGPALYSVEGQGARIGTAVRLDYAAPRLRGATPTLFFTRTFLGSERGQAIGMSTLGAGLRWVRKT